MKRPPKHLISSAIFCALLFFCASGRAQDFFKQGSDAYFARHFDEAAKQFQQAANVAPSAGAFHNLGDAEWQDGRIGPAILAWERAQWISPFNKASGENLRFARRIRLLDAPDLTWYEAASTWLPVNAWPWIVCLTFWLGVAMLLCPNVLYWRRRDWHQALAAGFFALFLLTLPTLIGIHSRAKIGIVLMRESPLRLTPTADGESLTRLNEGEIVRAERERGNFIYVRTSNAKGWIARDQFGSISRF